MIPQSQIACTKIGAEGCFFLTECYVAEFVNKKAIDVLGAYQRALDAKLMRSNCFIENHAGLMTFLTGRKWGARFENDVTYKAKPNEYVAEGWVWGNQGHWIFQGRPDLPRYDSMGDNSPVVFRGRLNMLLVLELKP